MRWLIPIAVLLMVASSVEGQVYTNQMSTAPALTGVSTDGVSTIQLYGTQSATGSVATGIRDTQVFSPNGPTNVEVVQLLPHLGDSHGVDIANFEGFFVASMTIDSAYVKKTPAILGFEALNAFTDSRSGGAAANSSATCTQGDFETDANYVYVCTATNTWKRAALSTF